LLLLWLPASRCGRRTCRCCREQRQTCRTIGEAHAAAAAAAAASWLLVFGCIKVFELLGSAQAVVNDLDVLVYSKSAQLLLLLI
jgi:hypothetical protein